MRDSMLLLHVGLVCVPSLIIGKSRRAEGKDEWDEFWNVQDLAAWRLSHSSHSISDQPPRNQHRHRKQQFSAHNSSARIFTFPSTSASSARLCRSFQRLATAAIPLVQTAQLEGLEVHATRRRPHPATSFDGPAIALVNPPNTQDRFATECTWHRSKFRCGDPHAVVEVAREVRRQVEVGEEL
jgi:hypothetical protein